MVMETRALVRVYDGVPYKVRRSANNVPGNLEDGAKSWFYDGSDCTLKPSFFVLWWSSRNDIGAVCLDSTSLHFV